MAESKVTLKYSKDQFILSLDIEDFNVRKKFCGFKYRTTAMPIMLSNGSKAHFALSLSSPNLPNGRIRITAHNLNKVVYRASIEFNQVFDNDRNLTLERLTDTWYPSCEYGIDKISFLERLVGASNPYRLWNSYERRNQKFSRAEMVCEKLLLTDIQSSLKIRCIVTLYHEDQTTARSSDAVVRQKIRQKYFVSMLNDPKFSDFTILNKTRKFHVHRAVLANQSDVFRAMFEHTGLREATSNSVEIEDFDPVTVGDFLHYIYGGQIRSPSSERLIPLIMIANKYNVAFLKEECENLLIDALAINNASDFLIVAYKIDAGLLREAAAEFIATQFLVVKKMQGWEEIEKTPELVRLVLEKSHPKVS